MPKREFSLLFLGKNKDEHCSAALRFCQENFQDVRAFVGEWGDPLSPEAINWRGDYIISYLSRWIVPESLLKNVRKSAINFHPASPDYPGIGCVNFALYEGASEYGATCHHMRPSVDTGEIIAVRRFSVLPSDDVASLLARTYEHQFQLFQEVMGTILRGEDLPKSSETWTRKPITRREFNELTRLRHGMSAEEIARRTRATRFGKWEPTWVDE